MSLPHPTGVAHADWGAVPAKRWVATATLQPSGRYLAEAPQPVGAHGSILERMGLEHFPDGTAVLGFDFPIGVPLAYAQSAGIASYPRALLEFGRGPWIDFFRVAETRDEISVHRPFYPRSCPQKGMRRQSDLTERLGLAMPQLLRRCETATGDRRAACSLFWTLGGNQVGKGALTGWRELLQPALRAEAAALALWPFDGELGDLIKRTRIVVAETYPAEFYGHLGVRFDSQLKGGKRSQDARRRNSLPLLRWVNDNGVGLTRALHAAIDDGFGPAGDGEDAFDAVIGLLGMLNVVLGNRPAGEPGNHDVRTIEGWILGQAGVALAPSGQ
ncbi:MAG: hypothetical protein ABR564_06895 [Candidatus Dormibacteria bacterium]